MKKFTQLKYGLSIFILGASTLSHAWVWECENKYGQKMSLKSLGDDFEDVVIESGKLSGHFRVKNFWDGHDHGIMTGEKISISYAGSYGRIVDVDVEAALDENPTVDVVKIHFLSCLVDWDRNSFANKN